MYQPGRSNSHAAVVSWTFQSARVNLLEFIMILKQLCNSWVTHTLALCLNLKSAFFVWRCQNNLYQTKIPVLQTKKCSLLLKLLNLENNLELTLRDYNNLSLRIAIYSLKLTNSCISSWTSPARTCGDILQCSCEIWQVFVR